jgi:hypothetical protein
MGSSRFRVLILSTAARRLKMNIEEISQRLNRHNAEIIKLLSAKRWQHFELYFLIGKKYAGREFDDGFRKTFCYFYVLNGARGLNDPQKKHFFQLLASGEANIENILSELYAIAGYGGKQKLFLSFSTKLVHTIDSTLPIYDMNVAAVLRLPAPSQASSLKERIDNRVKTVYGALQKNSSDLLMDAAIKEYLAGLRKELSEKARREQFNWQDNLISQQKLLDSALWALYMAEKLSK